VQDVVEKPHPIVSNTAGGGGGGFKFPLNSVLLAMTMEDREDNQSILEKHVRRVFDGSNGQTPILSPPGRHSPEFSVQRCGAVIPPVHPSMLTEWNGPEYSPHGSRPSTEKYTGNHGVLNKSSHRRITGGESWVVAEPAQILSGGDVDHTKCSYHHHSNHGTSVGVTGVREHRGGGARASVTNDHEQNPAGLQRTGGFVHDAGAGVTRVGAGDVSCRRFVPSRNKSSAFTEQPPVPYPHHDVANRK